MLPKIQRLWQCCSCYFTTELARSNLRKTDLAQAFWSILFKPFQSAISDYNSSHGDRDSGHFLCEAKTTFVKAGWVRSTQGVWMVALQMEGWEQVVRTAKCIYKNRHCEYLPACYRYGYDVLSDLSGYIQMHAGVPACRTTPLPPSSPYPWTLLASLQHWSGSAFLHLAHVLSRILFSIEIVLFHPSKKNLEFNIRMKVDDLQNM